MKDIFRSLRVRNYRLYFGGQIVSLVGTWMQIIANSWLVLRLTDSGFAVGIATALQFGPMLFFGAWGGLFADRFPKRRTLIVTQALFGIQALAMGVLVAGHWEKLWIVYALTFLYGCVQVFDVPSRQAFVSEMVGSDDVINAVGLNSAVFNGARMVGPALAGFLIARFSISLCFLINSVSYIAVLIALVAMRERDLVAHNGARPKGKGQVLAGLRYVRAQRELLLSLLLMAVVGTLALNFQTVLPLLAHFTFKGTVTLYTTMSVFLAAGSLIGAVYTASRKKSSMKLMVVSAIGFGVTEIAVGFAPTMHLEYIALPALGLTAMLYISASNSFLQIRAAPEMRGRVLALWSLVFLGSTPIGGPLVGWVSERWSPRWGLGVGGVASVIAVAIIGPMMLRRPKVAVEGSDDVVAEALEEAVEAVATGGGS